MIARFIRRLRIAQTWRHIRAVERETGQPKFWEQPWSGDVVEEHVRLLQRLREFGIDYFDQPEEKGP